MTNAVPRDQQVQDFRRQFDALRKEVGRFVVGQEEAIEGLLTALILGGHVLLDGLPGLGKTLLVRALAGSLDASFQRIQCTPDLMPADVIGTYVVMETPQGRRTFEFQKGPLFAHLVLADHVNRATPKTQSALLEAMDEATITVATESFRLPEPHVIVATQNPLESEGSYPLPEAQIDRFLLKLAMTRPRVLEMEEILDRTTGPESIQPRAVLSGEQVLELRRVARSVAVSPGVRRWAIELVAATHPDHPSAPEAVRRFVRHGCGPRAAQAMVLGSKVRALLAGRGEVQPDDMRAIAPAALRHRLLLNFRGQAEGVDCEQLIAALMEAVRPGGTS